MTINDALRGLNWNEKEIVQNESIAFLVNNIADKQLKILIQPFEKEQWKNAAIVLKGVGYPKIKHIVYDLLFWLQDMNWPGALEICDLLCSVPKEVLIINIDRAVEEAKKCNDLIWLYWLYELLLRSNIKGNEYNNCENYELLKKIYDTDI